MASRNLFPTTAKGKVTHHTRVVNKFARKAAKQKTCDGAIFALVFASNHAGRAEAFAESAYGQGSTTLTKTHTNLSRTVDRAMAKVEKACGVKPAKYKPSYYTD